MLDSLKTADRAAELDSVLRVVDGHVQAALGGANLLGAERDESQIRCPREPVSAPPSVPISLAGTLSNCTRADLAGAIQSGKAFAVHPR